MQSTCTSSANSVTLCSGPFHILGSSYLMRLIMNTPEGFRTIYNNIICLNSCIHFIIATYYTSEHVVACRYTELTEFRKLHNRISFILPIIIFRVYFEEFLPPTTLPLSCKNSYYVVVYFSNATNKTFVIKSILILKFKIRFNHR